MDNLKEQFHIERQKACEEEREFARQRYQKQLERDEMEVLWLVSFTLRAQLHD